MAAAAVVAPAASDIGDRMAAYLDAHLGQQGGGGECAHLAVEALRASGARFAWLGGTTSDYPWGRLMTQVTGGASGAVSSNPAAPLRVGDVIQYTNARFRDGTTAGHHTSIVAAVDWAGQVTAVYQQNFNEARYVTRQPLDLSQLIAGSVKVYRPLARTPVAGRYQFTIVNNTGAPVTAVDRAGTGVAAYSLTRGDSAWSYQHRTWSTTGGVRPTITVAGKTIAVQDGAAYEVYVRAGGSVAIRKAG